MSSGNFEKLLQLAKSDEMHFEPIGLILHKNGTNRGYDVTPKNTFCFASTGGDGVHYSFVCDGRPTDNSPIVMTVPMNDHNIIVGENLLEFLALGYYYGYFALEQLSYARDKTIAILDKNEYLRHFGNYEKELLSEISNAFLLKPWNNHKQRISELESKYFTILN
jgi:hypothetical protein